MLAAFLAVLLGSFDVARSAPTSGMSSSFSLGKRADLGVPTSWRDFSTSLVQSQRNSVAVTAMNTIVGLGGTQQSVGGLGYWQSANVWSALALKDLYAGTTDFESVAVGAISNTTTLYPAFRQNAYNDDTLWWATSAIYAYEAYQNSDALGWAEDSWTNVSFYQITSTSGNGKSFTWSSTCSSQSVEGGVFWTTEESDDAVNAITTGLFLALSARMYDATKDEKYLDAANAALGFIDRLLYDTSSNLVNDTIHMTTCETQPYVFTYNSGKYIEGLAVLGAVTGNSTYTDAAITTAAAGMKNAPWQGSDGIITEAANDSPHSSNNDNYGFKPVFIRALAELYRRDSSNTDLQTLIHSYVDVQANALIDLASDTGVWSNATSYAADWEGPYDGMYAWTQLAALDVFGTFVMVNSP